jgi:hypothetical protein
MNRWKERLRFLWEEEAPPPGEVPRAGRREPSGVPHPAQAAGRFLMVGTIATVLMGEVIGVRLVAPVDAATSYLKQCQSACAAGSDSCRQSAVSTLSVTNDQAYKAYIRCKVNSCSGLRGVALDRCNLSCTTQYAADRLQAQQTSLASQAACAAALKACLVGCTQ